MSDSLNHKIFAETDCISEQTLFDYIDKKLSAKECHAVERHLLHCEFCSDALEGLEIVKNRKRIDIINQQINERFASSFPEKKTIGFNYKVILSIAATVLLLIGGIFFFNLMNQKNEVAEFKVDEESAETPKGTLASEASKEEVGGESKNISRQENKLNREQSTITEDKKVESHYKTAFDAANESSAGSGIASKSITISETDEKDIPAGLAEAESDVSNAELRQQMKDSDNEEMKQQDEIAGETSNKDRFSTIPSAPKAEKTASEGAAESIMDQEGLSNNAAKNSKKERVAKEFSGFKAKKRDVAESEEAPPSSVVYAPQNIATKADDVRLETASVTSGLEQNPEYPGGQDSLLSFIQNRFNVSLLEKNRQLIKQTVQVQLTIDKKGDVKNIKIVKGINEEMDKELLRVLSLVPRWKPATNNGEAVSKQVSLPIQLK